MNTRAFTLALVISIVAMFMVSTYIEDQESELKLKYGQPGSVVIAKVDIKELELIDDSKVSIITVPRKFQQPKHFKTIKELQNTIATVPILKGEQITRPRVTFPGQKTGLSRQVSIGKRAVSVRVNDFNGVSRLIKPGDRVDVLSGVDPFGGRKDLQRTMTILQDVLILSTGYNMTNSIPLIGVKTPSVIKKMNLNTYSKFQTITLELNPFQVQKLYFVNAFGGSRIFLSLRNNNDTGVERIPSTSLFDVLGSEQSAEAKLYFQKKYKEKK
jgi:pilus assembly protein CpaB